MMLLLGCWWVVGEFLYQGKPFRRFKEGGGIRPDHTSFQSSQGESSYRVPIGRRKSHCRSMNWCSVSMEVGEETPYAISLLQDAEGVT